jgi:hypothetical protein
MAVDAPEGSVMSKARLLTILTIPVRRGRYTHWVRVEVGREPGPTPPEAVMAEVAAVRDPGKNQVQADIIRRWYQMYSRTLS